MLLDPINLSEPEAVSACMLNKACRNSLAWNSLVRRLSCSGVTREWTCLTASQLASIHTTLKKFVKVQETFHRRTRNIYKNIEANQIRKNNSDIRQFLFRTSLFVFIILSVCFLWFVSHDSFEYAKQNKIKQRKKNNIPMDFSISWNLEYNLQTL